jgi:hypothetical protein
MATGPAARHWQALFGDSKPARRFAVTTGLPVLTTATEAEGVSQQQPEGGRVTQQQPSRRISAARSPRVVNADARSGACSIPAIAARAIKVPRRICRGSAMIGSERNPREFA